MATDNPHIYMVWGQCPLVLRHVIIVGAVHERKQEKDFSFTVRCVDGKEGPLITLNDKDELIGERKKIIDALHRYYSPRPRRAPPCRPRRPGAGS
jgi:hypothetical protein